MSEFEAEKKFFGFHPVSFIDDVLNAMDDYCADAVGEMEMYMSKQKEFQNPNTRPHIKTGTEKILSILNEGVDKNMDKFELYLLRNIFKIPSGVKLDDTQLSLEQDLRRQEKEEVKIDKELATVREKILEMQSKNQALKSTQSQLDKDINALEDYASKLSFVSSLSKEFNVDPLKSSFSEMIEQSQQLTELIEDVYAKNQQFTEEMEIDHDSSVLEPASLGYDRSRVRTEDMKKFNEKR